MKKLLFILPLLFLFSCNSQKREKRESTPDIIEIVGKTKDSLKNLQTLSGKLRLFSSPLILERDEIVSDIEMAFTAKRNCEDSIVGWYFKSGVYNNLDDSVLVCRDFCDGKNYYRYELKDSILNKFQIDEANKTILSSFLKSDMRTYISFLNSRVTGDIYNDYGFGEITRLKDTVINGRYSYLIRNVYNKPTTNSEFTKSYNVEEIAIDTLTYIPIYFYKHYKGFKDKELIVNQKTYRELSDIKVNESLDNKIFECNTENIK